LTLCAITRPAGRRRPGVGSIPPGFISTPPTKLPAAAIVVRSVPARPTVRPIVGRAPGPSQPAVYEFRLRPLVARIQPLPAVPRPIVGKIPPAANPVVTHRPPAALVVRAPAPLPPPRRPTIGKGSAAHRPPSYLIAPLVVRLSGFPGPRPWPRAQVPWFFQTHVPLFPFGPRFTIAYQTLLNTLDDPGTTFTIRDPGLLLQLPRQ
jgi:hypothetical protein